MELLPAHDPYAAFRYRAFRLFSISYVLAVIGSQMLATTIQWDLYERTNDELSIALVGLVNAVPLIVLALPAGHVADSFSRKRVLITTQVFLAAAPLALAILNLWYRYGVSHWLTLSILGANSVALTFARPARSSIIPRLLPRTAYPNAFAWMSSLFETAAWIGPAVAGGLIVFGVGASYFIAGLCLVGCMALTLFLPDDVPSRVERHEPAWQSLSAGIRFVFGSPLILAAMTLDLLAVLLGGSVYLLPVFARLLEVGPIGYGWLRSMPAIGAFLMAVVQAHRRPSPHAGRALLWAVAVFGLATMVFGWSQNFWLSLAMLFIIGASDNVSVIIRQTLIQTLTPDAMRGRVSAVNQVFIGASNELGGVESGITAKYFGPVASVVGGGIGTLLVVLGVALKWPQIRRLGSLRELTATPDTLPSDDETKP